MLSRPVRVREQSPFALRRPGFLVAGDIFRGSLADCTREVKTRSSTVTGPVGCLLAARAHRPPRRPPRGEAAHDGSEGILYGLTRVCPGAPRGCDADHPQRVGARSLEAQRRLRRDDRHVTCGDDQFLVTGGEGVRVRLYQEHLRVGVEVQRGVCPRSNSVTKTDRATSFRPSNSIALGLTPKAFDRNDTNHGGTLPLLRGPMSTAVLRSSLRAVALHPTGHCDDGRTADQRALLSEPKQEPMSWVRRRRFRRAPSAPNRPPLAPAPSGGSRSLQAVDRRAWRSSRGVKTNVEGAKCRRPDHRMRCCARRWTSRAFGLGALCGSRDGGGRKPARAAQERPRVRSAPLDWVTAGPSGCGDAWRRRVPVRRPSTCLPQASGAMLDSCDS
jgi:hypothetical protein